jgi:hydrogenase expression/formation protein HypE
MTDERISLLDGAGGERMMELVKAITHDIQLDDGVVLELPELDADSRILFTTDSHVVTPYRFPGGDIGRLAACGTMNDLAVMGARPLFMACAVVMEAGFPRDEFEILYRSLYDALDGMDCRLVAGDTKVVPAGDLDGIVLTTTGVGAAKKTIYDDGLQPGDTIILTGSPGNHGLAILAAREGFEFDPPLESDVAPVWHMMEAAMDAGRVTAAKDPTRGGFATAINEMAEKSGVGIRLEEEAIPENPQVAAASRVLGIDPLESANEGRVVMGVAKSDADKILKAVRATAPGENASIIGEVVEGESVTMRTRVGGERFVQPPVGDPVPRVC